MVKMRGESGSSDAFKELRQGEEYLLKQSARGGEDPPHPGSPTHPLQGQDTKHDIRYLFEMTTVLTSHETSQPV